MPDGLCDWQGCQSQLVQPAIVRLHEDDEGKSPATDEWVYELCPEHTAMFAHLLEAYALHEEMV